MKKHGFVALVLVLFMGSQSRCGDLPWEKLPFGMKPLVQGGSENVAPRIRQSLEGWDIKGDVFMAGEVTNAKCDAWREQIASLIEKHMRRD